MKIETTFSRLKQQDTTNYKKNWGKIFGKKSFGIATMDVVESLRDNNNINNGNNDVIPPLKRKKKKRKSVKNVGVNEVNDQQMSFERRRQSIKKKETEDTKKQEAQQLPKESSLMSLLSHPQLFSDWQSHEPRLKWCYLFAFVASIDIMVNIPTLYDACTHASPNNEYLYAEIFACYVTFQVIGSLLLGTWMDRRPITDILLLCSFILTIGNFCYTHGAAKHNGVLLLVGRGLCGWSASVLVIGYAHVTRSSTKRTREERIIWFKFISSVGAIVGPCMYVRITFFFFF
ncbi:major facilitator transporter [Reticulomyxa filosa]|uniref:Major facilitator transporter n=1 Tax=Reticulomyxa filosa TaxID=46433 RepID=X6P352_RETFI|nr:major facilitator transporter [Reticulomyxa filosa]|eukprot:ETO32509.1 major facilitator transporter [Reticulomyxa filosa]